MAQASQSQSTNNNARESSMTSDSLQPNCYCSRLSKDDNVAFGSESSTETTATTLSLSSLFGSSRRFESLERHVSAGSLLRKCKSSRLSNCFSIYWLKKRSKKEASLRSQSARMAVEVDEDDLISARMKDKWLDARCQKMEALEREVAVLGIRLSNELDVHKVLERAQKQDPGSAISVPSFVSPKVKALMMELGQVNEDITRLERQISELQAHLTLEQEMNRNLQSRSRQQQQNGNKSSPSDVNHGDASSQGSAAPKRVSFEGKTLHFVSKAMKGDFTINTEFSPSGGRLSDCTNKENESRGNRILRRNGPWQKLPLSPSKVSLRLQQTPKVRYLRNRQLKNRLLEKHNAQRGRLPYPTDTLQNLIRLERQGRRK